MYLQKELLIYRKTRMNKKKENFNKSWILFIMIIYKINALN